VDPGLRRGRLWQRWIGVWRPLSFADSAPRAYWLKARNAYLTFSTSTGTSPNLNLLDLRHIRNIKKIFYSSSACIYPAYNQDDPANPNCSEHSVYPGGAR
jgi:hypothetical protein